MKLKIGVMGAHGTGKTTFVRELWVSAAEQVKVISGIARSCPWPINQGASEQAQRWIWLKHKISELEATEEPIVICDRTLLDSLVYAAVAGMEDMVDDYLPATLRWMESYDTVYWMRPVPGRLVDDGTRDVDPDYQAKVDRVFKEWIKAFGIAVTEVKEEGL